MLVGKSSRGIVEEIVEMVGLKSKQRLSVGHCLRIKLLELYRVTDLSLDFGPDRRPYRV